MALSCWPEPQLRDCKGDVMRDEASRPSPVLYSLLPSLVQRRIPRLRRGTQIEPATCHTRAYSQSSIGTITPPPSYQSHVEELDEPFILYNMPRTNIGSSRPSSSGSSSTPTTVPEELRSGVQWRYVDSGLSSLSLAAHEAATSTLAPSPNFVRRHYIDGVACVLKALPMDLTEEEELSIREALPASISRSTTRAGLGSDCRQSRFPSQTAAQANRLHQAVASMTLYFCLAAAFILPYVQLSLSTAYQYDRKHKISDRMLAKSVVAADEMRRRSFALASGVCALNDGKVGDAIKEICVYLVQGFSGGVYEGLGEALRVRGSSSLGDGIDEQRL